METKNLSFAKSEDRIDYICKIDSTTNDGLSGVIQIEQSEQGIVSVLANLPSMPPAFVRTFENPYGKSVIFELELPDGVEVTIKSSTEVINALWIK